MELVDVELGTAEQFASFMRPWGFDWIRERHPEYAEGGALQNTDFTMAIYRKTMVSQLREIVSGLLDPEGGWALRRAEQMVSDN